MIFLLALFTLEASSYIDRSSISVDPPKSHQARRMPGAWKEDALEVVLGRDGTIYCCGSKVLTNELAPLFRSEREKARLGGFVYEPTDGRNMAT